MYQTSACIPAGQALTARGAEGAEGVTGLMRYPLTAPKTNTATSATNTGSAPIEYGGLGIAIELFIVISRNWICCTYALSVRRGSNQKNLAPRELCEGMNAYKLRLT